MGETSSILENDEGAADNGGDADGDVNADATVGRCHSVLPMLWSTMTIFSMKLLILDAVEDEEAIATLARVFSQSIRSLSIG